MGKHSTSGKLERLLQRDHTLLGAILYGLDGHIIELQARAMEVLRKPCPLRDCVKISGMARGAIQESLDRIAGAFSKYGVQQPQVSITINLAPADLPKEGPWLDLPIAVIIMQAAGLLPDLPAEKESQVVLTGELGLHGELRRVPGILSLAFAAKPEQILVVPAGNEKECALVTGSSKHKGCKVGYAANLKEVIDFYSGRGTVHNALGQKLQFEPVLEQPLDFSRIRGQERAKRAAVIAATGGHNLALIGPPGEGKSLIASALPGILPGLRNEEKIELTRIYSAYGALGRDGMAVTRRPMRSIHHSTSKQALVGGGSGIPRPGEITLAHLGILFLDELAEFSSGSIESLRQPLENGFVDINRVGGSLRFPARFTLVAAMNPCPCGYFGTDACRCKESEVKKYLGKISGPIVDRIDLQVELNRLSTEERFSDAVPDGESAKLRQCVEQGRDRQLFRFQDIGVPFNAAIPGGRVRELCRFSDAGMQSYRSVVDGNALTTRSTDRLAKVARTVADLADQDQIQPDHVNEAASFVVGGLLRDAFR